MLEFVIRRVVRKAARLVANIEVRIYRRIAAPEVVVAIGSLGHLW